MRMIRDVSCVVAPLVLVLGTAAACAAPAEQEESLASVRGIDMSPELNPATGAVVLPADRFVETMTEMDILATASAVVVSACAAERGVTFTPPGLSSDPIYASEHYFGPWTRDQAQRFGFVTPMSDADLVANQIVHGEAAERDGANGGPAPNGGLTEEQWLVVDSCQDDPRLEQFGEALTHAGPWHEEFRAVQGQLLEEKAAQDALAELRSCYEDAGLTIADDAVPWVPRGANGREITEEQIRLALAVVQCKEEVGFTARMAAAEAELQAPIVADYADELVASRAQLDEALAAARALLPSP